MEYCIASHKKNIAKSMTMPRAEPANKCYHYPCLTTRNLSALVVAAVCGVLYASASAGQQCYLLFPCAVRKLGTHNVFGVGEKRREGENIRKKEKKEKINSS